MLVIKLVFLIAVIEAANVDMKTVNSKFKYKKMLMGSQKNAQVKPCSELPVPVLNDILGPAFNSRYV
jgi:hypothetical protein